MDGWIDFTNTWCFFTEAAPAPFEGALKTEQEKHLASLEVFKGAG
jgi:hypothetical protein